MDHELWWEVFETTGSLEAFLIYQQSSIDTEPRNEDTERGDERV